MNQINVDAFLPNKAKPEFSSEPNLPPAGHARKEELLKRTDQLEEKAETQYADRGAMPADSPVFDPEQNREIQQGIRKGYLDIGSDHTLYKTKWVNYVNTNAQKVWEAKALGWMVSTVEEFPEARDLTREDNTIRVGDVLLMHIRIDQYLQLEQKEVLKRQRQQFGVEAEIHNLAESVNRSKGRTVFAGVSTPELGESGNFSSTARSRMVQKEAMTNLGNRMKQGEVPGLPIK